MSIVLQSSAVRVTLRHINLTKPRHLQISRLSSGWEMHPSMSLSGLPKIEMSNGIACIFPVLFSSHFGTMQILCWFPFNGLNVGNFVLLKNLLV